MIGKMFRRGISTRIAGSLRRGIIAAMIAEVVRPPDEIRPTSGHVEDFARRKRIVKDLYAGLSGDPLAQVGFVAYRNREDRREMYRIRRLGEGLR